MSPYILMSHVARNCDCGHGHLGNGSRGCWSMTCLLLLWQPLCFAFETQTWFCKVWGNLFASSALVRMDFLPYQRISTLIQREKVLRRACSCSRPGVTRSLCVMLGNQSYNAPRAPGQGRRIGPTWSGPIDTWAFWDLYQDKTLH